MQRPRKGYRSSELRIDPSASVKGIWTGRADRFQKSIGADAAPAPHLFLFVTPRLLLVTS